MRVDNNGNYKVYAIKVTLKNHMEFGVFAASLPALERAYAAIEQLQLLIPEQPFSCFELNKATLCKGWELVCESNEMLARRVVQLTEELTTAQSMHVDNERYKWEQLGFGSVDELIEHFENAKQQLEHVKQQAKIHASECDTQKALVRDLCGLLGLRVHDFHCVSKAKNALEGRDLISAAKELEAIACSFPKSFSSISCDFLTERASIIRDKAKGMAWFSGATKYPAGECKHGVILYGNECLQCTREAQQGQGGAA